MEKKHNLNALPFGRDNEKGKGDDSYNKKGNVYALI